MTKTEAESTCLPLRRKTWRGWITSTYNLTFTTVDNNADDWEVRLPNGRIVMLFDKMPPIKDKNGNVLVLVAESDYSLMLNYIARDLDVFPGEVMSILREASNVRKEREDE